MPDPFNELDDSPIGRLLRMQGIQDPNAARPFATRPFAMPQAPGELLRAQTPAQAGPIDLVPGQILGSTADPRPNQGSLARLHAFAGLPPPTPRGAAAPSAPAAVARGPLPGSAPIGTIMRGEEGLMWQRTPQGTWQQEQNPPVSARVANGPYFPTPASAPAPSSATNLMQQMYDFAQTRGPGFVPGSPEDLNYRAGIMQDIMNNVGRGAQATDLGREQLRFEREREFGPGTTGPGGLPAIGAGRQGIEGARAQAELLRAQAASRESDQHGPEAVYNRFYMQAYNNFPQGTPHDARVRQLQAQNMPSPQFLTGRQQQRQGATAEALAHEPSVDRAFTAGMSAFPADATGRRVLPQGNPTGVRNAITQVMSNLSENELRNPEVRQRLVEQFGTENLDAWLNTSNSPLARLSGDRQQQQIRRFLSLAGQGQTPITPFTQGASFMERAMSAIPGAQVFNQGFR